MNKLTDLSVDYPTISSYPGLLAAINYLVSNVYLSWSTDKGVKQETTVNNTFIALTITREIKSGILTGYIDTLKLRIKGGKRIVIDIGSTNLSLSLGHILNDIEAALGELDE